MRIHALMAFVASLLVPFQAAMSQISAGSDAPLGVEFRAALLEDALSRTVEVYKRVTPEDDPHREKAIEFLTGVAHWLAGSHERPDYLLAFKPGNDLTRGGYDDGFVHWACGYLMDLQNHWVWADNYWPAAVRMIADDSSPYSIRTRMHALSVMAAWSHFHDGEEVSHVVWSEVVKMFTKHVSGDEPDKLGGRMLHAALAPIFTSMAPTELLQEMAAAIEEHIDDAWARETLLGAAQIAMAWSMRGHGRADTVTPEGWRGFGKHLLLARAHLLKAHAIAPDRPEAASYLIDVSRGGMPPAGTTARDWFDRAVEAELDYLPAYESFARTVSIRWGGSEEQLDAFANECIETGRFDTRVPLMALEAYIWMERDLTPEATWSNERRYEAAMKLLNWYAENAPENQRLAPRTAMLVIASRVGDWELADQLDKAIGEHLDNYTLWRFQTDHAVIREGLAEYRQTELVE